MVGGLLTVTTFSQNASVTVVVISIGYLLFNISLDFICNSKYNLFERMVLATISLLNENPHPTEAEIRDYLRGNICRCTGYTKIIEAVQTAAERMGGK